jgi:sugar phosphate isomerase/epimerase
MFKLGVITDQVSMDFEESLRFIKDLGLEYVEIHALWNKNIEELSDDEVAEAKRLVKKYDLKVSLISSTLFLQCHLDDSDKGFESIDDYFITISGDYDTHRKALQRCIELCDIFDTDKLRTFGFIKEKEYGDDVVVQKIVEKLKEPVEKVERAGVTLLLENCPHTYLQFGALTKRVIEVLGSGSFRALWDPANALRSGGKPYPEDYGAIKEYIAHMHAKDLSFEGTPHMVPLGEGKIDYEGILKSLVDDGYNGVISLEPEYVDSNGGRPEGCRKSLQGINRILDSIGVSI